MRCYTMEAVENGQQSLVEERKKKLKKRSKRKHREVDAAQCAEGPAAETTTAHRLPSALPSQVGGRRFLEISLNTSQQFQTLVASCCRKLEPMIFARTGRSQNPSVRLQALLRKRYSPAWIRVLCSDGVYSAFTMHARCCREKLFEDCDGRLLVEGRMPWVVAAEVEVVH